MSYSLPQLKCPRCFHVWIPRKPSVRFCPQCNYCIVCNKERRYCICGKSCKNGA